MKQSKYVHDTVKTLFDAMMRGYAVTDASIEKTIDEIMAAVTAVAAETKERANVK